MPAQRDLFNNGTAVTAPAVSSQSAPNDETVFPVKPSDNTNSDHDPSQTSHSEGIGASKNAHNPERVVPRADVLRLHASIHYSDGYVVLNWLRTNNNHPVSSIMAHLQEENVLNW